MFSAFVRLKKQNCMIGYPASDEGMRKEHRCFYVENHKLNVCEENIDAYMIV